MSYEDKYEQKGKWTYELPCTHKKFSDVDGQKLFLGLVARPVRLQFCAVRHTQRTWVSVQRECLCSRLRLDVVTTHSVGWGIVARIDFFVCNGREWPWCVGAEGIDGIGWRCHRVQGLLSSRTTFRRGWSIVFYHMSTFCGWWHCKILNESVISFKSEMGGTSF
jgi:hypothetical protein